MSTLNKTWNLNRHLRHLRQRFHGVMHATIFRVNGIGNYCFVVEVNKIEYIRILPYLFSRQEIHSSATMVKKRQNTHLLSCRFDDNFRFQIVIYSKIQLFRYSILQEPERNGQGANQNAAYLRDWPIKWIDIDRVTKDHKETPSQSRILP